MWPRVHGAPAPLHPVKADRRPAEALPQGGPRNTAPASRAARAPVQRPRPLLEAAGPAARPGIPEPPPRRGTRRRRPCSRASPQGRIGGSARAPGSICGRCPSSPASARAPTPPLSAAHASPQFQPARPLRPLSPRHFPSLRSWVRPAAGRPATCHPIGPARAAQSSNAPCDWLASGRRGDRGGACRTWGEAAAADRGDLPPRPRPPRREQSVWRDRWAGRQRGNGGTRTQGPRR